MCTGKRSGSYANRNGHLWIFGVIRTCTHAHTHTTHKLKREQIKRKRRMKVKMKKWDLGCLAMTPLSCLREQSHTAVKQVSVALAS